MKSPTIVKTYSIKKISNAAALSFISSLAYWFKGTKKIKPFSLSYSKKILSPLWSSPMPSPSASSWSRLGTDGQLSQESPRLSSPLVSVSFWSGLATNGQLSGVLGMPSLSASSSQASPIPSPSASSCPEFGVLGQLSLRHFSWK